MICRPGLRARLWGGAAALAVLAVLGAGIAAFGISRTQTLASEAMAAQRRIEGYGTYSGQVSHWLIGQLSPSAGVLADGRAVLATLDDLDRMVAEDVAAATTASEAATRARQHLTPARLRGAFNQLEKQLSQAAGPDASALPAEAALAFYAAQMPGLVSSQITHEARRRDTALATMQSLRQPLQWAATGIAVTAALVLLALYLLVMRPLFARLSFATLAAERLAMGRLPSGVAGHDELSLLFARLRQMAARLDRRRAALVADYAGLEATVTERTAALSQANARLSQIDSSRRRFFADVGHELRTPLTVIMGEAELGAVHPDAALRASFETIRMRALRLFRRIEDLLRIARSESGQLELAKERVDLALTVAAAIADVAPVLKRAGISVESDITAIAVAGDGEWLRQVFAGLLDNAAKYAGRGASVRLSARTDAEFALIDIADTGPGLPPERLDGVFDRFAREGGTVAGFGVGLALARWVVEDQGGSLMALSGGPGLTLRMTIPLWEDR